MFDSFVYDTFPFLCSSDAAPNMTVQREGSGKDMKFITLEQTDSRNPGREKFRLMRTWKPGWVRMAATAAVLIVVPAALHPARLHASDIPEVPHVSVGANAEIVRYIKEEPPCSAHGDAVQAGESGTLPISSEELELLARCVEAEAGGEGSLGMRLVADVILNRVDNAGFPDTVTEVITQPYHFASYWDGGMEAHAPSEAAFAAVKAELEIRSYPGLLYFGEDGYSRYGTPWKKVGRHYFSTN